MTPSQLKHFVSLELAQRMKAAGFQQDDTLFVWIQDRDSEQWRIIFRNSAAIIFSRDWCAAPIATEIELGAADDELNYPDGRAQMWINDNTLAKG